MRLADFRCVLNHKFERVVEEGQREPLSVQCKCGAPSMGLYSNTGNLRRQKVLTYLAHNVSRHVVIPKGTPWAKGVVEAVPVSPEDQCRCDDCRWVIKAHPNCVADIGRNANLAEYVNG